MPFDNRALPEGRMRLETTIAQPGGFAGTLVARLMSWRERLAGLQELAQWELALLVGLDILRAARDPMGEAGGSRGLLRGEGQGANVGEVRHVLHFSNQPEEEMEETGSRAWIVSPSIF